MANMIVQGDKFVLNQTISGAGTLTKTLQTENNFVDKDIDIITVTPSAVISAGQTIVAATDSEGILSVSSTVPVSGAYITVSGQAASSVTTGGWIDQNTDITPTGATKYYSIRNATFTTSGPSVVASQSGFVATGTVGTLTLGSQTIDGGDLSAGSTNTSIVSNGYYNGSSYDTSDKVTFESAEAEGVYKITSNGSATVNRAAVTKQVTLAGYFSADPSPVSSISSDSITVTNAPHSYYIKKSTLSSSAIDPSSSSQTILITEGYYPTDRTVTISPSVVGEVTTSLDDVGLSTYFMAGTSSDNNVTLTPKYTNTGGYIAEHSTPTSAGGVEYYKIIPQSVTETTTSVSGTTATRGTRTEGAGWKSSSETLDVASFANSATVGVNYVDISSTTSAPVLVSGGYLYINKGWTDNVMISLAKLVPNGSDVHGHADYILSGHSAYDNDGILVAGSIPTYDGSYTVA